MRFAPFAFLAFAGLTATNGNAKEVAKPAGELGSSWTNTTGDTRRAEIRFSLESEKGAVPGIYRPVNFDWRKNSLQQGRYPGDAIKKEEEGDVGLLLTIGSDGGIAACEVVTEDEIAAFNSHACPHLIKYAKFTPALSSEGQRLRKTYEARVSYRVVPVFAMVGPAKPYAQPPIIKPVLLSAPTLAGLGIDPATPRPDGVYGVGANVAVDAQGKATACTLGYSTSTNIDSLDKEICDRIVRDFLFKPALVKATGEAVSDDSYIFVEWPR